ncbi:MAG: response regulator [Bacteroidetes bacterium]|nr:response regulator [Bacteroidota bacterium]
MKHKLVLLVDDDADNNFVNAWILKKEFAEEVEAKQSAQEAIEYLRQRSNLRLELPSVIFLDIRMPIMDGFAFLDEFEKLSSHVKENCKIVMLSSSFDKSDYNRAMDNSHVVKYINKPLTPEALNDIK